jgi:uncharacterized protein YdaU (DUF1376 family)
MLHYYQFNIGDYASHTKHLSLIEDAIYRRLLDLYYLHEKPLNADPTVVARLINARGHENKVDAILREFFTEGGGGWVSARADQEIERFRHKIEVASRAGRVSAQRRMNERSTDVQPTNNHKPITNNQEPIKKHKAVITAPPDGVSSEVWESFLAIRKAKRAPMTTVALAGIQREAQKACIDLETALAMCCARGWQSFKASWAIEKQTESERAREQMHKLTRGLATPKQDKPFWAKTETVEVIPNVEPKGLL